MKTRNSKLYVKVAILISIGAIITAFIFSFFSYFNALTVVKERNYSIIEQLVTIVEKTASISAYVGDNELAQEIVDGLTTNILISSAHLSGDYGLSAIAGNFDSNNPEALSVQLYHPFINNIPIGTINIIPNITYIQDEAQAYAKNQIYILVIYSAFIAAFVSFLVHQRLTKPLQKLTTEFEKVDPAKPHTMIMTNHHYIDEIGILTRGINELMGEIRSYIGNEKKLRKKSEELERKFRLIFEQASAGICLVNGKNGLVDTNPAFSAMLLEGMGSQDVTLPSLFEQSYDVSHYLDRIRQDEYVSNFSIDLKSKARGKVKASWFHCLFSIVINEREQPRSSVQSQIDASLIEVIVYDVTERAEQELKARFEADHDALTHLKNRRAGERKIEELLVQSLNQSESMVLMMVDLDEFKPINDNYGHHAGDSVLIEVGKRLMAKFSQEKDLCVRWGGDEFVIARVLTDYDENAIKALGESLLDEIRMPIKLMLGVHCQIGASIGIVVAPLHATRMTDLIEKADSAMYRVKELGRDRFEVYDSNLG